MKNSERIINKLNSVSSKIENSIIRFSAAGAPHIVVDSKYSICYFHRTKNWRIWTGYATPQNKKVLTTKDVKEVIEKIEELRRNDEHKN
jgi:hypothetical protein